MDIKKQVKDVLLKENVSMTELVKRLNENKKEGQTPTTISSLNNKLSRGTIKYVELVEILSILGYEVAFKKSNSVEEYSSIFNKKEMKFIIDKIYNLVPNTIKNEENDIVKAIKRYINSEIN